CTQAEYKNTELGKSMMELSLEYWNKLASQQILVSSLLSGFSIAVTANLLVHKSTDRITINILKASTIAAGCFLITVFAMTKIVMMTTEGYPIKVIQEDFSLTKTIGSFTFLIGIFSLSTVIGLAGWTKSKRTGIFTTIISVLTFLIVLLTMIEFKTQ
ncbi:hypothetical protein, partial [Xanthovirga aplysinae]|uniref:hypothetical protein n=1 Tax=Xanthovirga aplysinae TaxID=2529853 RepID=UPI001656917E